MQFRTRTLLLAAAALLVSPAALGKPISTDEALALARSSSLRLERSRAQLEAAQGRALQAGLRPNPELNASFENFAGTGPYRAVRQSEATMAIAQPFELGGKRTARRLVAEKDLAIARLQLAITLADLEHDVRIAYAELRAAEAQVELARANLEQARALVRIAKALVDAGREPPLRSLRAETVSAQAEAEGARALALLLGARRRLAALTGSDDRELETIDALVVMPLDDPDRPTLDERLATTEREAADARSILAVAEGVPDITASAGFRRFQDSGGIAVVAGLSLPLPLSNRNQGNIAAARAEASARAASEGLARQEALLSRRQARLAYDVAVARLEALKRGAVEETREAVRLAEAGYRAGKFGLLELIDAQQAQTLARLSVIDAQLDRDRAEAALIRANAE